MIELYARIGQSILVLSKEPIPDSPTSVITCIAEMLLLYRKHFPPRELALVFHALLCLAKDVGGLKWLVCLLGVHWERFMSYATR